MAMIDSGWARWAVMLIVLAALASCATEAVYDPIGDSRFKGPSLQVVRGELTANPYRGTRVRWGGSIARVENRHAETWVEVVEHPLQENGRPHDSDTSQGRFLVRVTGFLDPAIYAEGRPLTVVGILEDSVQRTIGEYPYRFPVVAAEQYRLWEEFRESPPVIYYYPDPFFNYPLWWRHPIHPRRQ